MTNIDQFESEFRAASRPVYHHKPPEFSQVAIVTDYETADDAYRSAVLRMLPAEPQDTLFLGADRSSRLVDLLEAMESEGPDLIIAYRNLNSQGWTWPHSLGEAVDLLTQATPAPVLLVPNPHELPGSVERLGPCRSVMAITDHLAGDSRLVSHAAAMTGQDGTLHLTHVEDEATLERMLDAFSKIPEIDTDTARDGLTARLLADPTEYVEACRKVLVAERPDLKVEPVVTLGHRLREHTELLERHGVDLLVLNTKDDDQLAMHGLAYPLAVETRDTPLLML